MSYPLAEDLQAFALNAGVVKAGEDLTLDYGYTLQTAIAQWEQDTGWLPFIATEQTRLYDLPLPDGQFLDFRAGLLSISAFTVSNTTLTEGVDYYLYPLNAPLRGKPYLHAKFVNRYVQWYPWIRPAQISITGVYGYAADCPSDVRQALLSLATSKLLATKGAATGAVVGIKQDDVEIRYSNHTHPNGLTPQQTQLEQVYADAVQRYQRVRIL